MTLTADTLLERIKLKSQLTRWRIAAILSIVIALIVVIQQFAGITPMSPFIARYTIEGVIDDNAKLDDLLDDLKKNNNVKAIIIRINSPGGTVVGGENLYNRFKDISKKKPIVAEMRSIATSAGYMIALGTDHIFAQNGSLTGSIGVLVQTAEFTDMADKLGITPIIVKSSPLKASPSPLEKMTPKVREALESIIFSYYDFFVDLVAESRELPREKVLELADGRVYTGQQALNLQLIDEIGSSDEILKWLSTEKFINQGLEIRDVKIKTEPEDIFESLNSLVHHNPLSEAGIGLDGLVSLWKPTL